MDLLTPDFGLLFWMVLSFSILALILGKFGWPVIVSMIEERGNYIEESLKKAGALIASAFVVKGIANFGKECLSLGSDLQEVQNVVDVAFPKMNAKINEFAQNAATQFGLYCLRQGAEVFEHILPEVELPLSLLAVGDTVFIGSEQGFQYWDGSNLHHRDVGVSRHGLDNIVR